MVILFIMLYYVIVLYFILFTHSFASPCHRPIPKPDANGWVAALRSTAAQNRATRAGPCPLAVPGVPRWAGRDGDGRHGHAPPGRPPPQGEGEGRPGGGLRLEGWCVDGSHPGCLGPLHPLNFCMPHLVYVFLNVFQGFNGNLMRVEWFVSFILIMSILFCTLIG